MKTTLIILFIFRLKLCIYSTYKLYTIIYCTSPIIVTVTTATMTKIPRASNILACEYMAASEGITFK